MSFSLKLLIDGASQTHRDAAATDSDLSDIIDDDENSPLFLKVACRAFATSGVQFKVTGPSGDSLPVTVENDFVYFLEQLPSLLDFLCNPSKTEFFLSFWSQGIETQFTFWKRDIEQMIEVSDASPTRPTGSRQSLTLSNFVELITDVVDSYLLALERYVSAFSSHPWNQNLREMALGLKADI